MQEGPSIATVAALIGDPARSNMLTVLMDGRALTVSELADAAGVALPTASGHLTRLEQGGLLASRKRGRHRYYSLGAPDVADTLEQLMGLAARTGAMRVRTGPRDAALRAARVCYDHLAGERAVGLMLRLAADGHIGGGNVPIVTAQGRAFLAEQGVVIEPAGKSRRPLCRTCLDWSERKSHLGGRLGAAILNHILTTGWAVRAEGRVVRFTASGAKALDAAFPPC